MPRAQRKAPEQSRPSHEYIRTNTSQCRGTQGEPEYRPPWLSLPCVPGAAEAEAMRTRQCCRIATARRPWQVCFRPILVLLCLLWIIALAMPAAAARNESFWDIVLRIAGISANPGQLKGPGDEIEVGDLWVVNLVEQSQLPLTKTGGYHSPIFVPGNAHVLALKDYTLVRISVSGGEAESLYTIPGSVKLVGFSMADPDKVLMLTQGDEDSLSVGLLSLHSGLVTSIPYDNQSAEDQLLLAHLQGWERVYTDTKVYVKRESKMGMAGLVDKRDVYYKRGDKDPVNLSRCDGDYCGQPSLSHDGRQVVFVRVAH